MASSSSDGAWPCPFRNFHCCPDGEVGNKGTPRLISHIKRLHLSLAERRDVLREALSTDHGLYMAMEETLEVFGQWMCGKCMKLHAISRACHHPDGLIRFTDRVSGHIIGIVKPSIIVPKTNDHESFVLDVVLLDRVFKAPIVTVKSIPHGCRMAFSQALKTTLYEVVAHPGSIGAWVKLLLLPRCTLQVFKPTNRQESRSGNRKAAQNRSILSSLAT